MDVVTEEENVITFLNMVAKAAVDICEPLASSGADAVMFGDDCLTRKIVKLLLLLNKLPRQKNPGQFLMCHELLITKLWKTG